MKKPISISFAPNFEKEDTQLAWSLLFNKVDNNSLATVQKRLKESLSSRLSGSKEENNITLFSSGRSALYFALKSLGVGKGDEVIVQAFTCVAVPNAVLWNGATPVFCDIKSDYNFNIESVKKNITKKTKAIIIQHTFGIPGPIEEIKDIAKKHNIYIIEDCAHSLGVSINNKPLGTLGDVSIFSFGRDKIVSSVFGGAVYTADLDIQKKLSTIEGNLAVPTGWFVTQQLLYLIIYSMSLPLYSVVAGRILLRLSRVFGLLSRAVYPIEWSGGKPAFIEYSFSPKLALLALQQINKLDMFIEHRTTIVQKYIKTLSLPIKPYPLLRVPYIVKDKTKTLSECKQNNIHLGNWYRGAIDPPTATLSSYNKNSCPEAEKLAQHTINLPTHIGISLQDADTIVEVLSNKQTAL